MFCPNCGAKNKEDAIFCAECGYKLEEKSKKDVLGHLADCRQSPGICRDFYYEHCFSGIIELSERRCFL